MPESRPTPITPRLVLGLGVLTIGLLFTADSLGLLEADLVFDYWPVILIAVGATRLWGGGRTDLVFAGFWIAIGLWLLTWNLGYIDFNPFEFFWPLVIILFGLFLIFGAQRRRATGSASDEAVSIVAVMGGIERQNSSPNFQGGDITALMGGGALDLRQAELADGEAELRFFVMWGGYDLRVPPDWEVDVEVLPLLGAAEDKRTHQERSEAPQRLVLKGVVIMGAIEIKS